jgi:hypothetical protein
MKPRVLILSLLSLIAPTIICFSQDSTRYRSLFKDGIEGRMGIAYLATRDDHISDQKYTGPATWFTLRWSDFHETYGFRLGMTYERASDIKNYNVSAEVTVGTFTLADLYPIGSFELFGREVYALLGPAAELFMYYRKQHIAQNTDTSPDIYESGAWLFSLGARMETVLPFRGGLRIEAALQTSLLSLGGGTGSSSGSSTPIMLLTPLGGLRCSIECGAGYEFLSSVSVALGYRLQVTRISGWNYLLTASDNAFVSIGLYF